MDATAIAFEHLAGIRDRMATDKESHACACRQLYEYVKSNGRAEGVTVEQVVYSGEKWGEIETIRLQVSSGGNWLAVSLQQDDGNCAEDSNQGENDWTDLAVTGMDDYPTRCGERRQGTGHVEAFEPKR